IYELAGYRVFVLSCACGDGLSEIENFVKNDLRGKTAAFAGASGVGKSTLMNCLFPGLGLVTSDISRKIERGRHTTRHVELFPISDNYEDGLIADTPGFSMLDFERFDFFTKEELPMTMREFEPYIGLCKYKKCTHVKEEGCAIVQAVRDGRIAKSRHESFVAMYNVLKEKKAWDKS
ncbi:MAG: ribosome small subunit-dependent GTPase A, partial [Clostridia bacterium]|nr:ribosome small subunit-dependent GTPase A [Clostridia bacterium]